LRRTLVLRTLYSACILFIIHHFVAANHPGYATLQYVSLTLTNKNTRRDKTMIQQKLMLLSKIEGIMCLTKIDASGKNPE
jgi:hypothetical protein